MEFWGYPVLNPVIRQRKIPVRSRLVLSRLLSFYSSEGKPPNENRLNPSLASLARDVGCSRDCVWRAINRLCTLNIIKRLGTGSGRQAYEVHPVWLRACNKSLPATETKWHEPLVDPWTKDNDPTRKKLLDRASQLKKEDEEDGE